MISDETAGKEKRKQRLLPVTHQYLESASRPHAHRNASDKPAGEQEQEECNFVPDKARESASDQYNAKTDKARHEHWPQHVHQRDQIKNCAENAENIEQQDAKP
jgi:hypothetical protein